MITEDNKVKEEVVPNRPKMTFEEAIDKIEEKKKIRKMKNEETYESLHEYKVEQDRLIAQGKMQKPQIIYGFTPEDQRMFDKGLTIDELIYKLENEYGLKL